MNEKYIIRYKLNDLSDLRYLIKIENGNTYSNTEKINIKKISLKEARKYVTEIEKISKQRSLFKQRSLNITEIEILNAKTLQVVNIGTYEDEVPTSRFDLMDFD